MLLQSALLVTRGDLGGAAFDQWEGSLEDYVAQDCITYIIHVHRIDKNRLRRRRECVGNVEGVDVLLF